MASSYLEASIVQWADDLVTNQKSLGQVETKMATFALGGIHVALIADDQNGVLILGADLDFSYFAFLQVVFSFDCDEVGVVDFGSGEPQSVAGESWGKEKFLAVDVGGFEFELIKNRKGGWPEEGLGEFSHWSWWKIWKL